ncbi:MULTISPECIES: hypothetical protein [Bradyrhizobium]|jgi:hypothetical protein|uniref:hypothetical protein n=2 Tax=Nitrobacteraceae TaxID=41294 RepID=UPI0003820BD6|nr:MULTISPECIES: hypothetical protein [Bradyrhizobium]OSI64857.1 hypothetical protein BSZ22_33375 [Bradyrhizobium canariense]OSI74244.1 hypothetical protein BSZ23_33510 [Bradyrhizobium canariense]OSI84604.1 hypothetical protein BSZ25_35710 [Bradyrhizobium canariense]OSI99631.1 hypothetical protein BSZ24_00535 [Bradyrhizobium canariense]OSJ00095.1 hypothetical protein BSZ16_25895 [Bradyrhizobium canariense]
MMGNAMINALIAAGIVFAIGYGWITHLQNRGQRGSRAGASVNGGGDTATGTSDGFSFGSWFSSDSSGCATDGGSCSSSDSGSSGGDCGGGGDGGGGGGD